ncbi:MAG: TetR family transcriptional regulator [Nocardia sp.]|nr:TetR family transcriptional regulator [Nocardia sp.]
MISEVGYGNASLAKIVKHAGISKGVISYHFEGKDDLMTQLVIQLYVSGRSSRRR